MPKPKMIVDLQGEDGNIFALLHKAGGLLSLPDAAKMLNGVMTSPCYWQALEVIKEYVEIVDVNGGESL